MMILIPLISSFIKSRFAIFSSMKSRSLETHSSVTFLNSIKTSGKSTNSKSKISLSFLFYSIWNCAVDCLRTISNYFSMLLLIMFVLSKKLQQQINILIIKIICLFSLLLWLYYNDDNYYNNNQWIKGLPAERRRVVSIYLDRLFI